MRIPKNRKLEAVCSKDPSRPALLNPHFDGEKITATDGRALIRFKPDLVEQDDLPGLIPMSILKMSRSGEGILKLGKDTVQTKMSNGVEASIVRDEGYVYPDVGSLLKQWQFTEGATTIQVGLDAQLLYALTQANSIKSGFGKHHVILTLSLHENDRLKVIPVKFTEGDDEAFLMPIRIPD